ncbi:MAG: DUF2868 domain-containing protein [Myxococcota bacterium]|nr:DUF2868 domain-containing protein [Myxococcota bacterium]
MRLKLLSSSVTPIEGVALHRFLKSWGKIARDLWGATFRRTIHLTSAAFAAGMLTSAFLCGLTRAYQVSSESTFLSPRGIEWMLTMVLAPSRLILGALPPLPQSVAVTAGAAAPWFYHYLLSVLSWVILPRLIAAFFEGRRAESLSERLSVEHRALEDVPTLNIALAAYTNVGKTSLARTLLRRDVGEVRDAEHTTRHRAGYFMIRRPDARLRIWDTPGFNQPSVLLRVLNAAKEPWSWLASGESAEQLSAVDREAALALQNEADLIFYLVPAHASDEARARITDERAVLRTLARPVIVLLNRVHGDGEARSVEEQLKSWREVFSTDACVSAVLPFDAFHRRSSDEVALFAAICRAVSEEQRPLAERLSRVYDEERAATRDQIGALLGRLVDQLERDEEPLPNQNPESRARALEALSKRGETYCRDLQLQLLDLLGLEGALYGELRRSLSATVTTHHRDQRAVKRGAIWSGLVGGLGSGLAADLMAGGLTVGGGMIVGGLLGALTGAGVIEGHQRIKSERRRLRWGEDFLKASVLDFLSFYLLATASGRAGGPLNAALLSAERDVPKSAHQPLAEFSEQARRLEVIFTEHWPALYALLQDPAVSARGQALEEAGARLIKALSNVELGL